MERNILQNRYYNSGPKKEDIENALYQTAHFKALANYKKNKNTSNFFNEVENEFKRSISFRNGDYITGIIYDVNSSHILIKEIELIKEEVENYIKSLKLNSIPINQIKNYIIKNYTMKP